ncbi:MAG: cytochrome c biogenesis protein CcdA [Desulfobacteraceae bacterium]|nr:cytochrome c biogenesis protein CcdA [Desulfobacteraceae bacterium]
MFTQTISYSAAFLAGLLSFLSPCVLPLIPAYFTFITGFSLEEMFRKDSPAIRKKIFLSTLSFVCGFSVVFILMGAGVSFFSAKIETSLFVLTDAKGIEHTLGFSVRDGIRIIGGLIIILLGAHMTGWIRFKRLDVEKRIHIQKRPLHFMGTFLVGMAFAVGWSPCIGPLLGSILIIAGSKETIWQGVGLLSTYAAGLALPFMLISLFINFLLEFLRRASRAMKYINLAAGILLIVVGIFLLTDSFTMLNSLFTFSH